MPTTPRVALVTGSGKKRVGWYIADALAGEGYAVAVHYHTSAAEAEATVRHLRDHGAAAEAFQADLANGDAARGLIHAVHERFGRLDVLSNCAAVWHAKRLEEVTEADLTHHFRVNVLGTFLCAREAGLVMAAQPEGGSIVNFGDWAEARPYPDYAAYFATKGAVPALTRSLAVELGTRNSNIRVNCILPGPVLFQPDLPHDERRRAVLATLTQREGRPENVAQAVLFLVKNDFVTGASIAIDGGRTIYAAGN